MKIIVVLIFALSSWGLYAQDNIIKRDGSEIQAKVTEITETVVKYKRFDNPDGPLYSISKTSVFMIQYENGTRDLFKTTANTTVPKGKKKRKKPTKKVQKKPEPVSPIDSSNTTVEPITMVDTVKEEPIDTIPVSVNEPIVEKITTNEEVRQWPIKYHLFFNGTLGVGLSQSKRSTNPLLNFEHFGMTAGSGIEFGGVLYLAPKKLPEHIGLGLNLTLLNIAAGPVNHDSGFALFPYTTSLGPQFTLKISKYAFWDIYVKPGMSVLEVLDYYRPLFLVEAGMTFRYKNFLVGISGMYFPTITETIYAPTPFPTTHDYSHIRLRLGFTLSP